MPWWFTGVGRSLKLLHWICGGFKWWKLQHVWNCWENWTELKLTDWCGTFVIVAHHIIVTKKRAFLYQHLSEYLPLITVFLCLPTFFLMLDILVKRMSLILLCQWLSFCKSSFAKTDKQPLTVPLGCRSAGWVQWCCSVAGERMCVDIVRRLSFPQPGLKSLWKRVQMWI